MRRVLMFFIALHTSLSSALGGPIIFSTGQLDQFQGYRVLLAVDVDTGDVKTIGTGNNAIRMQGLAFAADGTLYGLQRNAGFVTINLTTGVVSSISSVLPGGGGQGNLVSGLGYRNGELFTMFAADVSASRNELLRYEIASDTLSKVGDFSVNGRIGAMGFSTGGTLVGDASPMYTINTSNAAVTKLPNTGSVVGGGFAFFSADSIYHMSRGQLASFNVNSGNRTLLQSIDGVDTFERIAHAPDGLFASFDDVQGELLTPPDGSGGGGGGGGTNPVPEPSSIVLFALGAVSLICYGVNAGEKVRRVAGRCGCRISGSKR